MSDTVRLTVDVVLITPSQRILLIQRKHDPYKGFWALPGGLVDAGESTIAAAHRELAEETGLAMDSLDLVGVYAEPGRDPRGRYVTFVYSTAITGSDTLPRLEAGDDAVDAYWWLINSVTDYMMAFDHYAIIADTLRVIAKEADHN